MVKSNRILTFAILILISLPSLSFAVVSGTVVDVDGRPIAGAVITSDEGEIAYTNEKGDFLLQNYQTLIHIRREGYRPTRRPVDSPEKGVKIVMMRTSPSDWIIKNCHESSQQRHGSFTWTPPDNARAVVQGSEDTVTVTVWYDEKQSLRLEAGVVCCKERLDRDLLKSSTDNLLRTVVTEDLIGEDGSGKLPNGRRWRSFTSMSGQATYSDVSPEAAVFFDKIMDGVCWNLGNGPLITHSTHDRRQHRRD